MTGGAYRPSSGETATQTVVHSLPPAAVTALRRVLLAYAAPAAAAYGLILIGTGIVAAALWAFLRPLWWLDAIAGTLAACARNCDGQAPDWRVFESLHYVLSPVTLAGVAGAAGWVIGRLAPRRPRAVAWAVGLVIVADGALALALPPASPEWVALLRPITRIPATWYLPTMWYRMEPLVDAARLALTIPAILAGVGVGAQRAAARRVTALA